MNDLPASVIVVSRHRPKDLLRCISALCQQDHSTMELIVVADPAAARGVAALNLAIKLIPFDEANISAARNAGLAAASGQVVAFIDDDAVAEPTWLRRLVEPFADKRVFQSSGFVIGRNGFSYQWRALEVDATGQDHHIMVPEGVSLHSGTSLRTVKTQGTNCGFRRDTLLKSGGFDPVFRFYLDEADVNLRLSAAGLTAVIPDAVVHHGFSESGRRRADRIPLSLHEIGASSAAFLRKHAPEQISVSLDHLRSTQGARLLRMMIAGAIEPGQVQGLLTTLEAGISDGRLRAISPLKPLLPTTSGFRQLAQTGPKNGVILSGRPSQRKNLVHAAQQARQDGALVTVMVLSRGLRRHRMRFLDSGIWWQAGGQFGASDRTDPLFVPWRFDARVENETARLSRLRPITQLGR